MTKRSKNGRHAIGITFSLIKCRCGAMRVRAVACPDCGHGADRFEVDVENQRRGRVAALCVEALDLAFSTEPDMTDLERPAEHLDEFLELAELPTRFLSAMQALERPGQGNPDDLVAACVAVGQAAKRLAGRPRRRPWIRTDNVAQSVADALVDMARKFLAAFAAPTPLLAQRHAETAQKSLDSVVEHVTELNSLRERWETIDEADDVGDWIAEALADAGEVRGTTGFADLDAAGRDLYCEITGRMPGDGVGLGLLISDVFSKYVGDEDAFRPAISAADQFLRQHGQGFLNALSRQRVVDELRNGFLLMADQLQLTSAAIAAALNDRQAVRSALDLMHTVFEGPGRRMVALMLDVDGTVRFEESLPADGAATIRKARDRTDIGAITYGFDSALRIAQAHQSYEFHDDHVLLRMRKKGSPEGQILRVSLDDLLDRVLASIECLNAIALVIQVHATDHGIDLIGDETLAALGVGPPQYGAALLRTSGYDDVEFDGSHVSLTGPKLTGAAVTVISLALPEDSIATVTLTTETGQARFEINIGLLRESSSLPEGLDKEFHIQRVLSNVQVDGEPGWSVPSMQRWVVGRAMLIVQSRESPREQFGPIMRELRQLLNFAKSEELPAAEEIRALMRYLRLTYEDRTSELDHAVFDRLGAFLAVDIPAELPFEYGSDDD